MKLEKEIENVDRWYVCLHNITSFCDVKNKHIPNAYASKDCCTNCGDFINRLNYDINELLDENKKFVEEHKEK